MSSSSLARLLGVCLLAAAVHGAFPPHTKLSQSPVKSCKFTIGDRHYDLCPLFSSSQRNEWTISFNRPTPPTETTFEYRIALDGPLQLNGKLPKHEQVRIIGNKCGAAGLKDAAVRGGDMGVHDE
jgi:hypothetical protein